MGRYPLARLSRKFMKQTAANFPSFKKAVIAAKKLNKTKTKKEIAAGRAAAKKAAKASAKAAKAGTVGVAAVLHRLDCASSGN